MDTFLFDLDGLLVDSEPLHYEAFITTLEGQGYKLDWDFKTYCAVAHTQSMGLKKAFLELYPGVSDRWPELYHQVKLTFARFVHEKPLNLMPSVDAFLSLLLQRGKKMAVVTNSSALMVLSILAKQPVLSKICVWITREDYLYPKPAPDGYLFALEKLGSQPSEACGFEDTTRGVNALLAAGVKAFHIHPHSCKSGIHFNSFQSLLEAPILETLLC